MDTSKWEEVALSLGWIDMGDHLLHEELDRVWTAKDFEGAVRDLGIDEAEAEDVFEATCA